MTKNNLIKKSVILLMPIIMLIIIFSILSAFVFAIMPPADAMPQESWDSNYVQLNPKEAFEKNPKKAVELYPGILDDFSTAEKYFTENPSDISVYPDKARRYLVLVVRGEKISADQEEVLREYIASSEFGMAEDIEIGDAYFVDGESVASATEAFSKYMGSREVSIKMPPSVSGINFVPPGRFIGSNGDADLVMLKSRFDFEVTPQGELQLIDKAKIKHKFTGSLEVEADNTVSLAEGTIDGVKIKDGNGITVIGQTINGKFTKFAGIVFKKSTIIGFNKASNKVSLENRAVIQSIAGDITIDGNGIGFSEIPKGIIYSGSATFTDGKISKIGPKTTIINEGFLHTTGGKELFIGQEVSGKNYFVIKKLKQGSAERTMIEASGKDFSSVIVDGNKEFPLPPANLNLPIDVISRLNIQSRAGLSLGKEGGKVQLIRTSSETEPLKLFARAEGYFSIINGNMGAKRDDITLPTGQKAKGLFDVVYERPNSAEGIMQGVDMRIEHLEGDNVKTYDMNMDYTKIRGIDDEEKAKLEKEIEEINHLKEILRGNIRPEEVPEFEEVMMASAWKYITHDKEKLRILMANLDESIAEKKAVLESKQKITLPIFGEVIKAGEKASISSSNFFTNPNIEAKGAQFAGAGDKYDYAALLVAATDYGKKIDLKSAALASAYPLAEKGYYVMLLQPSKYPESDYLKTGSDFLEYLRNPGLQAVEPGLKIGKVEVYSHQWTGGMKLTDEYRLGANEEYVNNIENLLTHANQIGLFRRYVRATDIRPEHMADLSKQDIEEIKSNIATKPDGSIDAEFHYKGCFGQPYFPMMYSGEATPALITNKLFGVPVTSSPTGTVMHTYNPTAQRWERTQTAPTPEELKKGWFTILPSYDSLSKEIVQTMFPGITGRITLHGASQGVDPYWVEGQPEEEKMRWDTFDISYPTKGNKLVRIPNFKIFEIQDKLRGKIAKTYRAQGYGELDAEGMAMGKLHDLVLVLE